jgi:hypothetical protein
MTKTGAVEGEARNISVEGVFILFTHSTESLSPPKSYRLQEGQQAGLEYLQMINPSTAAEERARIKAALLAYCGQDTLTMVKIREKLLKRF